MSFLHTALLLMSSRSLSIPLLPAVQMRKLKLLTPSWSAHPAADIKSYATKLMVEALEELANTLQLEEESISAANSEADESENSSSAISGMKYFSDTSANTLNDQSE